MRYAGVKQFSLPVFLFLSLAGFAQGDSVGRDVIHIPNYDKCWLHFGFSLAASENLENDGGPSGFELAVINDLRIIRRLSFRFSPGLSFTEQNIYYFAPPNNVYRANVEGTGLELPVGFKLRTSRKKNHNFYAKTNINYAIALRPQKNGAVTSTAKDHDQEYWDSGIGLDLYENYFKLSVELRYLMGLKDISYSFMNNTYYLRPQLLLLGLCFEG